MIRSDISELAVSRQHIENLKNEKRHHTDAEDMKQYELLKNGDLRSVSEAEKMFTSDLTGKVSEDPVRNIRYLFVASTTLACRAAISGGLEEERAYDISDLFIRDMDQRQTIEEIAQLQKEMIRFYTVQMQTILKRKAGSRIIERCLDWIRTHLHEPVSLDDLAALTGRSRNYLSTLFRKELGLSFSETIRFLKTEEAKTLLRYSDLSNSEIAARLNYSSQSHFISAFKAETGTTPGSWRSRHQKPGDPISI